MSITVIFPASNMTAAMYEDVLVRLEAAGAGSPPGREHHMCHGTSDLLGVVDVWESLASFEAFGEILQPILEAVGIELVEPQISETHKIIS
jgi:hypothetical protein